MQDGCEMEVIRVTAVEYMQELPSEYNKTKGKELDYQSEANYS